MSRRINHLIKQVERCNATDDERRLLVIELEALREEADLPPKLPPAQKPCSVCAKRDAEFRAVAEAATKKHEKALQELYEQEVSEKLASELEEFKND